MRSTKFCNHDPMDSKIFYLNYSKSQEFLFNTVKTKCKIGETNLENIKKVSHYTLKFSQSSGVTPQSTGIPITQCTRTCTHRRRQQLTALSCSTEGSEIRTVLVGGFGQVVRRKYIYNKWKNKYNACLYTGNYNTTS